MHNIRLALYLNMTDEPLNRPHSSENRFILDFGPPNNYRLRVHSVRWRDEGLYLCQISVHPPAILWSRLVIDRPIVHLLESHMSFVGNWHKSFNSMLNRLRGLNAITIIGYDAMQLI